MNQFQEQTGFDLKMRVIDSQDEVAMSENTALTNIEG